LGKNESHFLVALKRANEEPNADYHLSLTMRGEMNFFRNQKNADNWKARLNYFDHIGKALSPIFEAVYFFGKWKKEKDFKFALKSLEKFREMEGLAYEKNWFSVLSFCITEQVNLCFELKRDEDLKVIALRIIDYLAKGKESLQPRIFIELTRQFVRLLEKVEDELIEKVYCLVMDYLKTAPLNSSFQESFLNEALAIKKAQKNQKAVKELHRKILDLKIKKADEKGKGSNLLLHGFLEDALTYCVKYVHDKKLATELKKRLQKIDYLDELVPIELPEEEQKKLNEANKKYAERLEKSIKDYVKQLKGLQPLQAIYAFANDESLFNMRLESSKKFVKKLMEEHPIQNIFGHKLHLGHTSKKIDSTEEREEYRLHDFLVTYVHESIRVISNVFNQLIEQKIVDYADFYIFLQNCKVPDKNDFGIIMSGLLEHYNRRFLSSTSILTPKIESTLYDYLVSINADVSCYTKETISKRTLGGLIDLPEIEKNFSIDFQYFLKLLLVADDSINFRNRFAHGEVKIEEFNEACSSTIILILLKICGKTFKQS
jgi:hypothetical protein